MSTSWLKGLVAVAAIPVLVGLLLAVLLLCTTVPQLIWGFDDFPLGWAMLGLLIGIPLTIVGAVCVYRRAFTDELRSAVVLLAWIAGFDVFSWAVALLVTHIVES